MSVTGRLLVISGPSGVGKGTVIKELQKLDENYALSVSVTSRDPRKGEVEGVHYFFKSRSEFKEMIDDGSLMEWDVYLDNYYGSSESYVEDLLSKGKDVLFDITIKGAFELKKKHSECILIFLIPPSLTELRRRLEMRGTENEDLIEKRMAEAKTEMSFISCFDYCVINEDVEISAEMIRSIVLAEKCKVKKDIFDIIEGSMGRSLTV